MIFKEYICVFIIYPFFDVSLACSCNLVENICDINCCCDSFCSVDDVSVFYCYNSTQPVEDEVCVGSVYAWNFNGANINVRQTSSQTCFSSQPLNENDFVEPKYVSQSEFDSKIADSKFFEPLSSDMPISVSNFYKSGDEIFTFFNQTNQLGIFSFPQTSLCNNSPIRFLEDISYECLLDTEIYNHASLQLCSPVILPYLNPYAFVSFSIVNNPSYITNLSSGTFFVDETGILDMSCIIESNISCDSQIFGTSTTCLNIVQQVEYEVEYDGMFGLTKVVATLTVGDVDFGTTLPFKQRYSVHFVQKSEVGVTGRKSSGSPGYLLNSPIILARSTSNNMCGSVDGIGLNIPSGLCSSTSRQPVLFGVNSFTQCQFSYNASAWNVSCESWNKRVMAVLIGSSTFSHVSSWGTVQPASLCSQSPWIPIQQLPQNWNTSSCDLLTGLQIKVVYGNTGLRTNAQPAILALQYHYATTFKDLIFQQCWESECVDDRQLVVAPVSVEFFEKSDPNVGLRA